MNKPDNELTRTILSAPMDSAERIRLNLKQIRTLKWVEAPGDHPCPQCNKQLQKMHTSLMGPRSGAVRCKSCGYRSSMSLYLDNK